MQIYTLQDNILYILLTLGDKPVYYFITGQKASLLWQKQLKKKIHP